MKNKSFFKWIIIWSILILLVSTSVLSYSFNEDSLRICIAWAAKLAAVFFSMAFGVSSFHYLFKDKYSKDLLLIRPQLGLTFAVFHTSHLIFLLILQVEFHPVFDLAMTSSLIGGSLAYLFMYLMVLTTFPYFKNKVSTKNWNLLHTLGGYWIWLIFFRSYYKNVVYRDQEYLMFALLSFVILLRISRSVLRYRK